MTSDAGFDADIERIKSNTPTIGLTRRGKVERIIGWACSVIAIVSLFIGVGAAIRAGAIASCVNKDLGARNAPNNADNAVQLAFYRSLVELLAAPKNDTAAQAAAGAATVAQINTTYHTLQIDQAMRAEHPLGSC